MTTATSARKSSKAKVAQTHQHPDGTIHALSSDGVTVYTVAIGDAPSCTCLAGVQGRACYHVVTARSRYGAFFTAPWLASVSVQRACQAALSPGCDCVACTKAVA